MSFFTNLGIFVSVVFCLALGFVLVVQIIEFFGYQKGARLIRDYAYAGKDRSQFFWIYYGIKIWLKSFRKGGGWFTEVSDPEDDNITLRIYENGKLERKTTWYGA